MTEGEPLEGIAAADELLGRPFPLPQAGLPLVRWVEICRCGSGAEVCWNLDDTRPGAPGRLALYAGPEPPPRHELHDEAPAAAPEHAGRAYAHRSAPLHEAQDSLRPVQELEWADAGLHLRLTAQGPWELEAVLRIADSII
ncbi:MAG TPA: hypothetical protein VFT42_03005 [Solirubrobacteraceae bacterium]|nr:hypothetical protein [Solirubrobacteraceae bacterium]